MSTRRAPESDSSSDSRMEKIGSRVRQRALTGTEASTVGFILVGYIGAFAFVGFWLDKAFETSWIVAVGVLLGAVLGFREMLRMAQKLGRKSVVLDAENSRQGLARSRNLEIDNSIASSTSTPAPEVVERKRIFQVPAPPVASFEKSHLESSQSSQEVATSSISQDELLEELLDEGVVDVDKGSEDLQK